MAWSGGIYSRIHNWVTDKNAAVNITASRMDAEDDSIATGLNNCITKDGLQTVTANIPFAGFKLTGLGTGTASNDAARVDQLQDGTSILMSQVFGG